jgi:hypothetical protein
VQYCVHSQERAWPADDPYWSGADWKDAAILPPPAELSQGKWPLQYTIVHWTAIVAGLPGGSYDLCCRTIDANGIAQPMPRPPLPRTGVNAIHRVTLVVKV